MAQFTWAVAGEIALEVFAGSGIAEDEGLFMIDNLKGSQRGSIIEPQLLGSDLRMASSWRRLAVEEYKEHLNDGKAGCRERYVDHEAGSLLNDCFWLAQ